MRGNAFVMVTRSHVRVNDVRATCIDLDGNWHKASGNGMFFVWVAPPVNVIDDVEFYECHVVWAHTHGFNMNQDYNDGVCRATTNIRFLNCRAVGCGYGVAGDPGITDSTVTSTNQSRSEWITGFDFHEWQDLVNCEVVNCVASDNWESGFHLEPGARYSDDGGDIGPRTVSKNIVLPELRQLEQRPAEHLREPLLHVRLLPLARHAPRELPLLQQPERGYYVHGGANSSFTGLHRRRQHLRLEGLQGERGHHAHRLHLREQPRGGPSGSRSPSGITVTNFEHTNVVGDRGYQNILGGTRTRRSTSSRSRTPSFEITAVGNGMPIINQAGSGNTYALSYG